MPAVAAADTTRRRIDRVFGTRVADERSLISAEAESRDHDDCWNELIAATLVEWEYDPQVLADDGLEAPSLTLIRMALDLARFMRNEGLEAPTRIVPTANSGISFEWQNNAHFESITFHKDLSVESLQFENCRLISRQRIL